MKKFLILFCMLMLITPAFGEEAVMQKTEEPQEQRVLVGEAVFDWLDISQVKRDNIIKSYRNLLFDQNTVYKYAKKDFRKEYKDFLKDKNYKEHYRIITSGIKETENENLCGFYYKEDLLVSYAIQYKNDMKTVYYYDGFGHLKFVDKFSDNYPNFPYKSKQYKANGMLSSAIYFIDHDTQYMFQKNGEFKGVWYKDKMYDRNAK